MDTQFWYRPLNEAQLDSPSLLIYKARVQQNIAHMINMAGSADRLMVHVKTNKMPQVVSLLMAAGISRFKCATIAEAEMVARAGATYIVLAHQLVGPKIERFIRLRQLYPHVFMASLVDNAASSQLHNDLFAQAGLVADVLVDVNNGMDRSGHPLNEQLLEYYTSLQHYKHLNCHGLHVYDGQWREADFGNRRNQIEGAFENVEQLMLEIEQYGLARPMLVAGGTPSFSTHVARKEAYCSPGTCVLWDWGYGDKLQEQPFEYAALLLTRVVSKPANGIVTVDLGHKAVAAENPIDKRVRFLNLENYELLSQSEEHGVLRVENWEQIKVGDVYYGVPYHICPTVNLYSEAYVVEEGQVSGVWEVLGSRRRLSV